MNTNTENSSDNAPLRPLHWTTYNNPLKEQEQQRRNHTSTTDSSPVMTAPAIQSKPGTNGSASAMSVKDSNQCIVRDTSQKENQPHAASSSTSSSTNNHRRDEYASNGTSVAPMNQFPSLPSLPPLLTSVAKPSISTQSKSIPIPPPLVGGDDNSTPNRNHRYEYQPLRTTGNTTMSSPLGTPCENNGTIQVLRYGETVQSFFQLNENSTEEYRNLCYTIDSTQSSLEQKASAWRRLLEIRCQACLNTTTTTTTVSTTTVTMEEKEKAGNDLLRWHRRATSYFTSVIATMMPNNDTKVVQLSHRLRRDLLQIWLSYVTVQARYCPDHNETARMTLRHIQNQSYLMMPRTTAATGPREAKFYLTWSRIEETCDDQYKYAESILRQGIQHRAEPIIELHEALRILQRQQQQQQQQLQQQQQQPQATTTTTTTTMTKSALTTAATATMTTGTMSSKQGRSESESNTFMSAKKRIRMDDNHHNISNNNNNIPIIGGTTTTNTTGTAGSQDSNMSMDTETEDVPTTTTTTTETNHFDPSDTKTNNNNNIETNKVTSVEKFDSVQFQLKSPIITSTKCTDATGTTSSNNENVSSSVFDIPVLRHRSHKATELPSSSSSSSSFVPTPYHHSESTIPVINDVKSNEVPNDQRAGVVNDSDQSRSIGANPTNVEGKLQTIDPKSTSASKFETVKALPTASAKSSKANVPPLLLSSNQKVKGNARLLASSFKRPPLQFKTFGLGKAERIDPSQSIVESDSDDDESKNETKHNHNHNHNPPPASRTNDNPHKTPNKKPKISKMDLDYMWNWDPEKRLTSTTTTCSPATSNSIIDDPPKSHQPQQQHHRSVVPTTTSTSVPLSSSNGHGTPSVSLSSSSSNSNSTATSSSSSSTHSTHAIPPPATTAITAATGLHKTSMVETPPPMDSHIKATTGSSNDIQDNRKYLSVTTVKEPATNVPPTGGTLHQKIDPVLSQDASNSLMNTVNHEFLPLIQESNIIRVNQEPYVKLGVIGKGGSCKVYRALSKDCSVLAIKRVKTEDLDRKAIDGYANEIALLKRLRGNPAIIQLHDSEVDTTRQVILLVMEAGEADLNHVLQRQSIGQGTGKERSLNMNFIRLTWQQMLKAVHSIHEQRIIHGDLKPANFLFVRGSLKLIDFGIAKAIQNDNTNNIYRENQIGTLNYMSPEAICDSGTSSSGQRMKCGRPSDIWSLGCILYQMVYGKTPFADLQMIPKLQAIVNPAHKISYPSTIDEAAIDAIQCCLHRDPKDRAPIVGDNGLLNEHRFLNSRRNSS